MEYTTIRTGRSGESAGRATTLTVSRLCLGTMWMGTRTDEETSVAILDRFVEAGGTFVDTANNYNSWLAGHGRESEELLGRWLASRGNRDEIVLATKCGAAQRDRTRPLDATNFQGLAPAVVRREADLSRKALGTERLDLFYAHVDDRGTPLEDVVEVFGALAAEGTIGVPGISNVSTWRLAEARRRAVDRGVPGFGAVQQHGSYLYPRPADLSATFVRSVTPELLDYAAAHDDLTVLAYSPLLAGAYAHPDRLDSSMGHASNHHRIQTVRDVAVELGATPGQVVLAWLMGGPVPVIPVFGASSVAQLEETLGAADLVLDPDTRRRLDAA